LREFQNRLLFYLLSQEIIMSTITYDETELEVTEVEEVEEKEEAEEETAPEPEIFSLSQDEIDRIFEEEQARPKLPPDPCLLEDSSEDYDDEPITEYQDSMDAAGYPYW
jgi:hypothetical protein